MIRYYYQFNIALTDQNARIYLYFALLLKKKELIINYIFFNKTKKSKKKTKKLNNVSVQIKKIKYQLSNSCSYLRKYWCR